MFLILDHLPPPRRSYRAAARSGKHLAESVRRKRRGCFHSFRHQPGRFDGVKGGWTGRKVLARLTRLTTLNTDTVGLNRAPNTVIERALADPPNDLTYRITQT